MRLNISAALCAVALWLTGSAPASALDACWPGCAFGQSKAAPAKATASKSAQRSVSRQAATKPSTTSRKSGASSSSSSKKVASSSGSSSKAYGGSVATSGGTTGIASYYWQPQRVASGGWFNPNAMTAAHKTLPFGTRVRVTHLGNGRSVDVTINDRGPYIAGRIIDLSKAAAGSINMQGQGVAQVRMTVLGR